MNDKLKINGIRLNKNFIQLTQKKMSDTWDMPVPLCQILEANRINMVFMSLNTVDEHFVSGTICEKYFEKIVLQTGTSVSHSKVCTISIYPHSYNLRLLGFFLTILGQQKIFFRYMVSSGSMLTLVTDQKNCESVIRLISESFDLPGSHVPFEQGENEELTLFLQKKFPETSASYVEEKIKTYGITLISDLILGYYMFSFDQLAEYGRKLESTKDKKDAFFYISANMTASLQTKLFLLTGKSSDIPAPKWYPADILSFHGPHFGDRHSIISRALNCLSESFIPVLQVGCTGASISIVLPQGNGKTAKQALLNVFEVP
jgi:aspartokinase